MFVVTPHEEGFRITWSDGDIDSADELRSEIMLEGLSQTQEWTNGIVLERYRNEYETLQLLSNILLRLKVDVKYDADLEQFRQEAEAEHRLYASLLDGEAAKVSVAASVDEFPTRQLLDYQCLAVSKHLGVVNSADFSVPGSGKTTVALANWAIARRASPELGLWVIGPLSAFQPWEDEFLECFDRQPNVVRIRGDRVQRGRLLRQVVNHELILCSYHTAWREEAAIIEALRRRPWLLVLDESHYVKSTSGALSSAVRHLAPYANRRMILTGTPMPRAPEDLWSLFTYLWPTVQPLGNAEQFLMRCRETPTADVCRDLRNELAPLFHRTCKHDLGLPDIQQSDHCISPETVPATQRLIIRLIENRTVQEAEYLTPRDQAHLRRWRRARIIRLLQAVTNPELLADALAQEDIELVADGEREAEAIEDSEELALNDEDTDLVIALKRFRDKQVVPAKAQFVADRCRHLVSAGEKVVIWAYFHRNVDLLSSLLNDLHPLSITGRVPAYDDEEDEEAEDTREQRIRQFKSRDDRPVLIASSAACAEAISLHRECQHAIYFERTFNAAHFIQSLDRIHRQGMPKGKTAHVDIPYIPCAIERVLNRRLRRRQAQLYQLLNDPMPVIGFDDEAQTGFFDLEDFEDIDGLFEEVLAEIRDG